MKQISDLVKPMSSDISIRYGHRSTRALSRVSSWLCCAPNSSGSMAQSFQLCPVDLVKLPLMNSSTQVFAWCKRGTFPPEVTAWDLSRNYVRSSLLLLAMPEFLSSFSFLVVRPGVTSGAEELMFGVTLCLPGLCRTPPFESEARPQ